MNYVLTETKSERKKSVNWENKFSQSFIQTFEIGDLQTEIIDNILILIGLKVRFLER